MKLTRKDIMEAVLAGLLVVLAFSLLVATCEAQTLDLAYRVTDSTEVPTLTLRLAHDQWLSVDKGEHMAVGMGSTALSALLWYPDSDRGLAKLAGYNVLLWGVWEVKDAIIPWERWGAIGGDGFSHKDWIWSAGGVAIVTTFILVVKK